MCPVTIRGSRWGSTGLSEARLAISPTTSTRRAVSPYFLVRWQPHTGAVRPYVDGRLGFNYMATRTTAGSEDSEAGFAQTTHFDDFALTAGVGGGVAARLYEWADGELGLDIGGHYVYGAPLRYLVPGVLGAAEGVATFDERLSRADLFTIQLGAYFEF